MTINDDSISNVSVIRPFIKVSSDPLDLSKEGINFTLNLWRYFVITNRYPFVSTIKNIRKHEGALQ